MPQYYQVQDKYRVHIQHSIILEVRFNPTNTSVGRTLSACGIEVLVETELRMSLELYEDCTYQGG
ncbi:hypothetical protein CsatA_010897 [Cannabis sativa]